jgi:hypothetical protein
MSDLTKIAGLGTTDSSVGFLDWTNPENIETDDGNFVTSADYNFGDTTYYLLAKDFDFSDLPDDATIEGVEVLIKRMSEGDGDGVEDTEVNLIVQGTVTGDNYAKVGYWPTSNTEESYGGASDLWNVTELADEDAYKYIKDPTTWGDFGVVLSANIWGDGDPDGNYMTAKVDYIKIKVHYTGGSVEVTGQVIII